MNKLQIPKKLNPDLLTDTIIEVKFTSNDPFEIFIGKVYDILIPVGYEYSSPTQDRLDPSDIKKQITVNLNALQPTFKSKDVAIKLTPNSINFNSAEGYIGWEKYFEIITDILRKINSAAIIVSVNKSGLSFLGI